jgi:hypothetical protein
MLRDGCRSVVLTVVFIFTILLSEDAYALTNITLNYPQNGAVFNATNNVTFNCSVDSDNYIRWLSLYHNINGSFVLNQTEYFGELRPDSSTALLMHFNNESTAGENGTRVYDWSGNGNNGTVHNATFNTSGGKYLSALEFDGDGDYMEISDSSTLDLVNGTIEMWIKTDEISGIKPILIKESGCADPLVSPYAVYLEDGYIKLISNNIEVQSSSAISPGSWYHLALAFIWNGTDESTEVNIYINGTLDKAELRPSTISANNDNLQIGRYGSSCSEQSYFNGLIDELVIYNRPLSADEIQEHYNRTLSKNASASWNITNITDGTYKWNCLAYDNNSQSTWAAANSTFYVDLYSPPNVTSITLSPSSADDLDPGVTINVTANITDPSNVSTAIFQHMNWSDSDWTNKTMTKISNIEWNTSFDTSSEETIYYYRIWANDTLGRTNYSATYSVNITSDYSWNISSSELGIESGMVNENNELGTLIVNNTGDNSLNFTLTDDWYPDVYYNGSLAHTYSFSLPKKTTGNVTISATFEDHANERNFTINITAYNPLRPATPALITVNVAMNSYTSGPYFSISVLSPPLSVYQNQTFNLTAKVKNMGNETANSTILDWTLPAGWDVSGNKSVNIGSITSGSTSFSNITITINPNTASPGTYIIQLNATCNQTSSNNSARIGVSCSNDDGVCGSGCSYVTDDDCTIPSGGGSVTTLATTAGIVIVKEYEYKIELIIPSRFDINRGESKILRIGVNNTVSGSKLNNVYLSLSGYPQTFIGFSPPYITAIEYGETRYFDVEVRAPIYAVYNEYYLNVNISGKFIEGNKTKNAEISGKIFLVTHKFVGNETLAYFDMAVQALNQMTKAGFETTQISNLISEMNKSIEEGNYDNVKELAEEVMNLKDSAFRLNGQIQKTEKNIENIRNQNFNMRESEKMISLAKSAFLRGDYKKAEERLSSTMLIFAVESGGAKYWIFLANYWWILAPMILAAAAGTVVARKGMTRASLVKKLDALVDEERVVQDLIEILQKEHFVEKRTGTESYERSMKNYENGLNLVKKKKVEVLLRLSKKLKFKDAVKKLEEEERRVKGLIIDNQKKYFQLGKMGKTHYEKNMKGLRLELMEVQRIRETLDRGRHA